MVTIDACGPELDLRHVAFEGKRTASRGPCAPRDPAPTLPAVAGPADDFALWVLRQAGIDPSQYRLGVFLRRVAPCLRALQVKTVPEARVLLEQRRDVLPVALNALLIGVTNFFRDPPVFDALRSRVLPILARRRRPLRVWSAACSTGAELYSVAILMEEAGLLDRAQLVGTDCRHGAIEEARAGWYASPATDSLPQHYARRYFTPDGDNRLRPIDRLRERVQWEVMDLHAATEDGPWDLLLWRNTAIYLEPAASAQIYRRLAGTLAFGGFLVLGKAERPPALPGLVAADRCIYRGFGAAHVG